MIEINLPREIIIRFHHISRHADKFVFLHVVITQGRKIDVIEANSQCKNKDPGKDPKSFSCDRPFGEQPCVHLRIARRLRKKEEKMVWRPRIMKIIAATDSRIR